MKSSGFKRKPRPSRAPSPTSLNFQPSGQVVHATTVRELARPQPKAGRLESPVFLRWTARRGCAVVGCREQVQVHHWPVKGMGGATQRDDKVIPLCVRHHDDAQTYRIPAGTQNALRAFNFEAFFDEASEEEIAQHMRDRKRWREKRVWVPA